MHSGEYVTKYEKFDFSEVGRPEEGIVPCLVTRCTDCGEVVSVTRVDIK